MFFLISCETTLINYAYKTQDLTPVCSGAIKRFKKGGLYGEHDIVLQGTAMEDTPGLFTTLLQGENTKQGQWQGEIHIANVVYKPVIYYHKEYQGRKPNVFIYALGKVRIEKLPAIYQFEKFSIFTSPVRSGQMPIKFASFFINQQKFFVQMTVMGSYFNRPYGEASCLGLLGMSSQVFQIVDEQDSVYAEFTKDFYTVFKPDTDFNADLLKPVIGIFSVIRDIGT